MRCNYEILQLYLWEELDSKQLLEVENHLLNCPSCKKELENLQSIYHCVDEFKPGVSSFAPEDIWEKIVPAEDRGRVNRLFNPKLLLRVAVLFLVFAAGIGVGRLGKPDNPVSVVPDEAPLMVQVEDYFHDIQPLVVNLANDVKLDEEERSTGLIIKLLNKNRALQNLIKEEEDFYIKGLLCDIEIILMDLGRIAEARRCSIKKKSVDYEDVVMKLNMFSVSI